MKQEIINLRLEGKSYNQIAKIVGCSKSSVSYHCQKLETNDELKKISIRSNSIKQERTIDDETISRIKNLINLSKTRKFISEEVGISLYLIKKICRKNGFKYPSISEDIKTTIILLRNNDKTISDISKSTGVSRLTISLILNELGIIRTSKVSRYQRNNNVKNWRIRTKQKLIEYKGGSCSRCGYNKCNKALQFHHLDPNEKDFNISSGHLSFDLILKEVDKCILVCANCHAEIHDEIRNSVGIHPV